MYHKYSVDIVNVVNEYCSWKRHIFMEYLALTRIERGVGGPGAQLSNRDK
jgi:hypothetical protein